MLFSKLLLQYIVSQPWQVFCYPFLKIYLIHHYSQTTLHKGRSRAALTSKMERFVIIVNGFQPLTIITKRSILDVAAARDLPLLHLSKPLYVRGCVDLRCPGTSGSATGIPNFFYLKRPCISFPFSWIKLSRVLVLLIFSGGDCVVAFLLEPHLTQYLSCSPSSSSHEGQKRDTRRSILNWLGVFLHCVAHVRIQDF